jgi:cell division protein FtsX
MDYKEYQQLYDQLLSEKGLAAIENEVGEKDKVLKQINDFLGKYPTLIPKDKNPTTPVTELSIKEIYRRTLQSLISIIQEISDLISQRNYISQTTFRRRLFEIFTTPERRLYVGILLMLLSFMLYFIDSAA